MASLFVPAKGGAWDLRVIGVFALCALLFALLQLTPKQYRKYVIQFVTLVAGLYYALEFFWPISHVTGPTKGEAEGNFLTPSMEQISDWLTIIGAFTVGLGVINLSMVHSKRLTKGGNTAFNSLVFFLATLAMVVVGILNKSRPNSITSNLYQILFDGALTTLDATMFSIIAFYIVSASYRAFRVRSTEATILLITAVVVMLGQIAAGQALTRGIHSSTFQVLHFEVVRDWILTLANAAAVRAIGFGLGIGGLAVALRIWLGLERGSYFDGQG